MHRARTALELEHSFATTPDQWVVDHISQTTANLRHATVEEAWKAWGGTLAPLVESIQPTDIIKDIGISPNVLLARHFQFTFAAIDAVFSSLGLDPGSLVDFVKDPCVMVPLLNAASNGDNAARNALPLSQLLPLSQPELHRVASTAVVRTFRVDVLNRARAFMAKAYANASAAIHGAAKAPTLFLPAYVARFEQTYCADLRARFAVRPSGLSAVACCIPTCPHYLVPLAPDARAPGLHPRLRAHLDSATVVPGLHKVGWVVVWLSFAGCLAVAALQAVVWLLVGCCLAVAALQAVVWLLFGCCLAVVWLLFGCCSPSGCCLAVVWLCGAGSLQNRPCRCFGT